MVWPGKTSAAAAIITERRQTGDELTKKAAESFVAALNLMRTRAENTDTPFLNARERFLKL